MKHSMNIVVVLQITADAHFILDLPGDESMGVEAVSVNLVNLAGSHIIDTKYKDLIDPLSGPALQRIKNAMSFSVASEVATALEKVVKESGATRMEAILMQDQPKGPPS